ncbi:MAG TPA: PD-(D/E)XK nuclease family protein, partial [Bacillales bacterium]|nr:PD-(D/E)XK nuclease family protein [Bacillales bacterium]
QHLSLSEPISEARITETLDRLVVNEIMTEGEVHSVDVAAIMQFFQSDLGRRMLTADKIEREVPFSLALPAKEAYADWDEGEESVLIQGVIDCLMTEKDGLVLIDYKSDAIKGRFINGFAEAKPILADRYRLQLDLYAKAVRQIRKKPLKEKYLYFFDGGHLLPM